jgi:hypothetical protein
MSSRGELSIRVYDRSDGPQCKHCLFCLFTLCMIGASSFYTYYGIKMLWENRYMYHFNSCSISHLWQLVLVNVVFAGLGIFGTLKNCCGNKDKNEDEKEPNVIACALCLAIIILTGMVSWELVEIYGIPDSSSLNITDLNFNMTNVNITACKELMNTNIWSFAQITNAIHIAGWVIIMGISCIMGCMICCSS